MYKIGDFSKKIGVPIKTLRYYDEIDLFRPSYQDIFTGYRYYENEQIGIINKIIKLKGLNLSLNDIKEYLLTNDINILLNKEREFRMKIEAITNYVEEISYEIKKGGYDDYIKWNGLRAANTPPALELKDNMARLYMIFKNDEFDDDFLIYTQEDNLTSLTNTRIIYSHLNLVLEFLRNEYDFITFIIPEEDKEKEKIIRENCTIIEDLELEQKGWNGTAWKYKKFKIQLK